MICFEVWLKLNTFRRTWRCKPWVGYCIDVRRMQTIVLSVNSLTSYLRYQKGKGVFFHFHRSWSFSKSKGVDLFSPFSLIFHDVSVAGSSIAPPIPCSVSPCMYGAAAQYHHTQDALLPHHSGAEVRNMVSSLPPINTVFMGSTGGPPWLLITLISLTRLMK